GTFTDIVAVQPDGRIRTRKLLSENPEQYRDAAIQGIRDFIGVDSTTAIPVEHIASVRMGTTVATNALLEHKGDAVLLLATRGFADALRIGYQQRPDLFALDIQLPQMLYSDVIEAQERVRADGHVEQALDLVQLRHDLQQAYDRGLRSIAIVFMHAWQYPQHERQAADLAAALGFTQISVSHEASALIKFIGRGDTTVVDAYLSPVLQRYVSQVAAELPATQLLFMQSNGGLAQADFFHGKDAILSGPAGGVVGMVQTAQAAGFEQLIGFDMGGTSTDVCHYDGEYERTLESLIAGKRIRAPMMRIHTVAAGGSSILHFDGRRFRVGPDSAGADPGPVCYRRGGPLTITDCNVMLGKLQADFFPQIFGESATLPLDVARVKAAFQALVEQAPGQHYLPEQMAAGFLQVAIENMANAIKKISLQRGYDVSSYTLCCFGGASGQHACLVAEALGMSRIFLHPYAGVLSAYGMGLAQVRKIVTHSIEQPVTPAIAPLIRQHQARLAKQASAEVRQQTSTATPVRIESRLHCRYAGSDSSLLLDWNGSLENLRRQFEIQHRQRYGFVSPEKALLVASIEIEAIAVDASPQSAAPAQGVAGESGGNKNIRLLGRYPVYMQDAWRDTPFYARDSLSPGHTLSGPAVIVEDTGTTVIEPQWRATVDAAYNLVLDYHAVAEQQAAVDNGIEDRGDDTLKVNPLKVDPVKLEIFNNLFMSIAEQMGFVLEQTAVSVNIKERLDFSCAIFDADGNLVANAPHMPVHLGSMSESIRAVIRDTQNDGGIGVMDGDAFVLNDPYNGGTHLPDITVIKPVFDEARHNIIFYVASRGHHADIGGVTPGSIPPHSRSIQEEGILINTFKLVERGVFREAEIRQLLAEGDYPARNIDFNIADLKAQLAACTRGENELRRIIGKMGLATVQAYMSHVQDNAEASVRAVIGQLHDGDFSYAMDDGSCIRVSVRVDRDRRCASIDFTGSSEQHAGNFNAPTAITRAAVLYVFRCLVQADIPLNEGCLKPLDITIPAGSLLNPAYPAAVVAGNVETSQAVVDALFGALGIMGAAQGTMNNVTWGNRNFQYYETLCGGAGGTAQAAGASAVHTHMTNSRLTDPEVLELRFPVVLDAFTLRAGSGGAGRHRGGDGVVRSVRFLEAVSASIVSGHRRVAPYGMAGGADAMCGENRVIRADGAEETVDGVADVQIRPGDSLRIATPGGGGYGETK
ncbi:MAG TPA: 5-oxoprolinase, partial [Thiotrichales bacterium]|nr:5-oxoprolinase [Thiotrichales bacterium]